LLRVVFCLVRRPVEQTAVALVCLCLGCELDRGRPTETPRLGGARPAGPPPPDPWAKECFPALRQSLVGACKRARTVGSLCGC